MFSLLFLAGITVPMEWLYGYTANVYISKCWQRISCWLYSDSLEHLEFLGEFCDEEKGKTLLEIERTKINEEREEKS